MTGHRGSRKNVRMEELETLWKQNSEPKRRRQRAIARRANDLTELLWALYDLTGEPCFREAGFICATYGLGDYSGTASKRLGSMKIVLSNGGRLVEAVDEQLAAQQARGDTPRIREAYATIAAQEGVPSPQFSSAIKRVERAYKARKRWALPTDGHTGGRLLVGRIVGLDQLRALRDQITFSSPKELQLREQAAALEVPEEITIRDVHWVQADRHSRRAIAAGELVLLLSGTRIFLPLGSDKVRRIMSNPSHA